MKAARHSFLLSGRNPRAFVNIRNARTSTAECVWCLLFVFLVLLGLGCPESRTGLDSGVRPSQIVEEFVLHESASGERLYTLRAETAYVYDAEQRVDVVAPRVSFYEAGRTIHALLTADRGVVYSQTEDLVAHGHVVVVTEDSTRLWTDSLLWNNRTKLITTDAPVEIQTPKGRVTGVGLVADAGLTKIEIQSAVQGSSSYRFDVGTESSPGAENAGER